MKRTTTTKQLTEFINRITQRSVILFVVLILFLTLYFFPLWYLESMILDPDWKLFNNPDRIEAKLEFLSQYISSEDDFQGITIKVITSVLAGLGLGYLWSKKTKIREKAFGLVLAGYIGLALIFLFHSHTEVLGTLQPKLEDAAFTKEVYDSISGWISGRFPETIMLLGLVLGLGGHALLADGQEGDSR